MLFYTWQEIIGIVIAAIIVDLTVGDPKWPTHPVIWMGRLIKWLEHKLMPEQHTLTPRALLLRGFILTGLTLLLVTSLMYGVWFIADTIHLWLGYIVSVWFISTTIAIKGLKDAAYLVMHPLQEGNLADARKYTGYIVGRDTEELPESELSRAVVETVAENTVDAVFSPIIYALIGGAPLAMLYRASNTLDSMVGYRNAKYIYFGRASARWDDVMNWIPARLTGLLLALTALIIPKQSAKRSLLAIFKFASKHPSPNSGIPESAVAGALGIELGGLNIYGGFPQERARMGWPLRELNLSDIQSAVRMMYGATFLTIGGLCILWALL
ncbi:adenosylcobinamide-phosphate synthase CbiB [Paenibacillus sp. N1-5-1-14]|uniref:adenosylcobinamide-phosphate synthase CbiB n=1 Tax=Paenibacillus radicibacter TaxID=2972488 RepID=UPI00215991AE|nr:adenosylcobinamide-phosphate synthase CbiB [Paenibacillus radicibacter]MCR8644894.1 adenosylcobinamide-phosphate synthase CbiB [Paenibacillus radicibacter]